MDHISRIEIFLQVVKCQSFSLAARNLNMTAPAVSKHIKKLEEILGVKLLQRTTRQINLTEEGAIYNEKAKKAIEDLDEAKKQIQELKSSPVGTLKINAPMSFGKSFLTKMIADFAVKYPDVKMEIEFDDRNVDMIAEGYDISIRIGFLKDSSLIARKLAPCPLILCASKDFINKYGEPKRADELIKFPAIIYNRNNHLKIWQYEDQKGNVKIANLQQKFSANNAEMMLEACLNNVGIAILPIFIANDYLKSNKLIRILPKYKTSPERGIYAIFPQNRYLSTKVRLFIDSLAKYSQKFDW